MVPAENVEASPRIGAAPVQALLAVAHEKRAGAVLDSNWVREDSADALLRLPGRVIEVFCHCELQELRRRYHERAGKRRGRIHDFHLVRPEDELWNERSMRPLSGEWPVVTVNTEARYDVAQVAHQVCTADAER